MFITIKLRGHIEEGSMPGEQWNTYLRAAFIPPPEIVLNVRIDIPQATPARCGEQYRLPGMNLGFDSGTVNFTFIRCIRMHWNKYVCVWFDALRRLMRVMGKGYTWHDGVRYYLDKSNFFVACCFPLSITRSDIRSQLLQLLSHETAYIDIITHTIEKRGWFSESERVWFAASDSANQTQNLD
ncbi:uncharacterized protein EV420DRAFT_1478220 [Desarmillaria tabescens]|uniref:Uncharacterized protein n=1 Tax=Armillaria tabescens TaxID=1929756 RepID=A0AA39N7G2_ARMTA|nr:uncharacterized protein EV420DRAFT_1478220 [Desarmillaria tabescens]KAK0460433.1 hypothetical protein EV420DRAFT_1478220 [Desarmillaria tabescens]